MPYVEGFAKVRVWVPGGAPGAPDQGLPGEPEYPDQGLPGFPEYPGHPLPRPPRPGRPPEWGIPEGGYPDQGLPPLEPRPPRPVYPIVEDHELGGHPELPDLNMTRRITVTDGLDTYTAYALEPEPPQVEEGYEPRYPTKGLPGSWVAVLYGAALTWAWVRTPGGRDEDAEAGHLPGMPPDREPKRLA